MKFVPYIILSSARHPVFEGEGDSSTGSGDPGQPPADGGGGSGADPKPGASNGAPPKDMLSQDKVNALLAAEKRKYQQNQQNLTQEIEALKAKSQLTASERSDLDQRVEKLKEELLTKEQIAAKKAEKMRSQHEEALNAVTADRDSWKGLYTTSTIQNALIGAAVKEDAFNPQQIVAQLGPHTKLEPILGDDDQPTGKLAPVVRLQDVDKDGKPITLSLSPEEAVKGLKEKTEYMNLFKGEGVGGLGANHQRQVGGKADLKSLASDPAAYRKAREDGTVNFNR